MRSRTGERSSHWPPSWSPRCSAASRRGRDRRRPRRCPRRPRRRASRRPNTCSPRRPRSWSVREGLAVGLVGSYGRSAVPTDLLSWQLATGAFAEPREGALLNPGDKTRPQAWARVEAGADGWIAEPGAERRLALRRRELGTAAHDGARRVRLLRRARQRRAARRREIRHGLGPPPGPPGQGPQYVLLFQGERGRIRARLFDPPAPVFFVDSDATLPDIVIGETRALWAGIRLVNTTEDTIDAVEISYSAGERRGTAVVRATIPAARRPASCRSRSSRRRRASEGAVQLTLNGRVRAGTRAFDLPPFNVPLKAVKPTAHYVRTFVSEIDGSVQYLRRRAVHRPGRRRPPRARRLAARRERRRRRSGARLQAQGLGRDRRADQPAPLRIRLGGLGAARRARSPRRRLARFRHRPRANLSHRPLDGRPRDLVDRRQRPRPVGGDRAERGLAELLDLRRRAGLQGPDPDRDDADAGESPGRNRRPGKELPALRRLRAARRPGRQRPGGPGTVHARAARQVPPRLRLLRAPGRRPLVGRRVRGLAAAVRVPPAARAAGRRRHRPRRVRHGESRNRVDVALGDRRRAGAPARVQQGDDRSRRQDRSVQGHDVQRGPAGADARRPRAAGRQGDPASNWTGRSWT